MKQDNNVDVSQIEKVVSKVFSRFVEEFREFEQEVKDMIKKYMDMIKIDIVHMNKELKRELERHEKLLKEHEKAIKEHDVAIKYLKGTSKKQKMPIKIKVIIIGGILYTVVNGILLVAGIRILIQILSRL